MVCEILNNIRPTLFCLCITALPSWPLLAQDTTRTQLEQQTLHFVGLIRDKIWEIEDLNNVGIQKPDIEVHDADLPAYINDGTLSVPLSFAAQVTLVGLMLQHDVAVDNYEELTVQLPLIYHPLSVQKLISLLPDYAPLIDENNMANTAALLSMVQCSEEANNCQKYQALGKQAISCLSLFIIGHEITHYVKHHQVNSARDYPLQLELEADQGGLTVLKKYIQGEGSNMPTLNQEACLVSPAYYLQLNISTQLTQHSRDIFETRRDEILTTQSESSLSSLPYPDDIRGGLGSVAINWQEDPALIVLDGMKMKKSDFDKLLLPVGRHFLLYTSATGVGLSDFRIRNNINLALNATFVPFTDISKNQLAQEVENKDWLSVLQATSDFELRPDSIEVREAHWKALRMLSAATWINPQDLTLMDDRIAIRATRWYQSAMPLYYWEKSLVTAGE